MSGWGVLAMIVLGAAMLFVAVLPIFIVAHGATKPRPTRGCGEVE